MLPVTLPFDSVSCSSVNSAWGALTIEVLARLGVETVITSPGARCAPLTLAAARNARVEALSILDERSAAFFALGISKRTHRPVALISTSGTAAANYFPAVIEASLSGTPLIIMTADRPPELRNCSSGQTIDQSKIFGTYVRHYAELALPEATEQMLSYLRQTLVHSVNQSTINNPGPVHLNFPFREPLFSPPGDINPVIDAAKLEAVSTIITRPCDSIVMKGGIDQISLERLSSHTKGVLIVGVNNPSCGDDEFAKAVNLISQKLGWPIITDILNPVRNHTIENHLVITHYDTFLRNKDDVTALEPTAILQIGTLPTSKVLNNWLESLDAVTFLLTSRPINTDPLHRLATPVYGNACELSQAIEQQSIDPYWSAQWMTLEEQTASKIDSQMHAIEALFEGKVSWLLSRFLPTGTSVFLANSMSIRYAEYLWSVGTSACSIFCNRGANGIDGTLSTAIGVAHRGVNTVLLIGDLAFLHDINGLLSMNLLKGSLSVIVINNNGGGIFEHLPVANDEPSFEHYFATPQNANISQLCASYGAEYTSINNWDQLIKSISNLPQSGVRVVEIITDRKADLQTLSTIQAS